MRRLKTQLSRHSQGRQRASRASDRDDLLSSLGARTASITELRPPELPSEPADSDASAADLPKCALTDCVHTRTPPPTQNPGPHPPCCTPQCMPGMSAHVTNMTWIETPQLTCEPSVGSSGIFRCVGTKCCRCTLPS